MNTNRIQQLFGELAKVVIETGMAQPVHGSPDPTEIAAHGMILRGNMLLWGTPAAAYNETCLKIFDIAHGDGAWSLKSIESVVGDALLRIWNSEGSKAAEIGPECAVLLSEFQRELKSWTVDLFVSGMRSDCVGFSFGRFAFCSKASPISDALEGWNEDARADVFARTEVQAVDQHSAIERARKSLEQHLSILNAICSDGLPSTINLSASDGGTSHTFFMYRIAENGVAVVLERNPVHWIMQSVFSPNVLD